MKLQIYRKDSTFSSIELKKMLESSSDIDNSITIEVREVPELALRVADPTVLDIFFSALLGAGLEIALERILKALIDIIKKKRKKPKLKTKKGLVISLEVDEIEGNIAEVRKLIILMEVETIMIE